jgi:hypothetical protein
MIRPDLASRVQNLDSDLTEEAVFACHTSPPDADDRAAPPEQP